MNGDSPSFVDHNLARRMELTYACRAVHYARAYAAEHPDAGVAVEEIGGGYAISTGPALPVNRAVGLGMGKPVVREDLEAVIDFYHSRGLPARVDLCPLADHSLLELLVVSGFHPEGFLNMLFRILDDRALDWPQVPGIQVAEIEPGQRGLWLDTVASGFADREEHPPQEVLEVIRPTLNSESARCYLAWVNNQPVGGGALIEQDYAVELGSASTRPSFRRMGVQTALIYARLADARRRSCNLATILTSPGSDSQRNAQHLGFEVAYTRFLMVL